MVGSISCFLFLLCICLSWSFYCSSAILSILTPQMCCQKNGHSNVVDKITLWSMTWHGTLVYSTLILSILSIQIDVLSKY